MAKAAPSRLAGAIPCWLLAVSRPIPDLSPIGNQTNLMVFGPGRYLFLDVLRYGWPLSLLYALTVPALVLWLG